MGGFSYAQDGVGAIDFDQQDSTVRSVHVNSNEIVGKPDWCSYAIEKKMSMFMDDDLRNEYQSHPTLYISGRTGSCLWMSACQKSWDITEYYLEGVLRASKEIQMECFEEKKIKVSEYNLQAQNEQKPLKQIPLNLPQLRGVTDEFADSVRVPLEIFVKIMEYNCNFYFTDNKLEKKINPKLSEKNDVQDEAYVTSDQFASGMFRAIHYRFVELQQNHVLFTPAEGIYPGYFVYDFVKKTAVKKE